MVKSQGTPTVGAAPLNLGSFEAMDDWGDQSMRPSTSGATSLPADSFEAGNLAALEEDDDPVPSPQSPRSGSSWPAASAPVQPAAVTAPQKDPGYAAVGVAKRRSGGGSGALIAVVVVVMAAAGALGAYFGGLLH